MASREIWKHEFCIQRFIRPRFFFRSCWPCCQRTNLRHGEFQSLIWSFFKHNYVIANSRRNKLFASVDGRKITWGDNNPVYSSKIRHFIITPIWQAGLYCCTLVCLFLCQISVAFVSALVHTWKFSLFFVSACYMVGFICVPIRHQGPVE